MVARQTNPFMGTCGTVSWQVVEINIRWVEIDSWTVRLKNMLRERQTDNVAPSHGRDKYQVGGEGDR